MEQKELRELLEQVSNGSMSVEQAMLQIKLAPFADLGYAKLDLHRAVRQGAAEVIYGAGKTPEQIRDIAAALLPAEGTYVFRDTIFGENVFGGDSIIILTITVSRSSPFPISLHRRRKPSSCSEAIMRPLAM